MRKILNQTAQTESLLYPPPMTTTDRVRTTISLDPEVYEIFKRMAELTRTSVSRCMGEWLADTADGAQFVAAKMAEARNSPMTVMREMQAMAVGLQDEVDKTMAGMRSEKLRPKAEGAVSASAAASSGRLRAPSSHTGLKSPKTSQNTGSKSSLRAAK